MEYEKVTEMIIGCVYRVYNNMGFGFLEFEISDQQDLKTIKFILLSCLR